MGHYLMDMFPDGVIPGTTEWTKKLKKKLQKRKKIEPAELSLASLYNIIQPIRKSKKRKIKK
jgi:hypothetical protein